MTDPASQVPCDFSFCRIQRISEKESNLEQETRLKSKALPQVRPSAVRARRGLPKFDSLARPIFSKEKGEKSPEKARVGTCLCDAEKGEPAGGPQTAPAPAVCQTEVGSRGKAGHGSKQQQWMSARAEGHPGVLSCGPTRAEEPKSDRVATGWGPPDTQAQPRRVPACWGLQTSSFVSLRPFRV